jgi:preprotein translocase subunit SecG
MSLIALVISVLLVVRRLTQRRKEDQSEANMAFADEEEERLKRGKVLRILTVIVGVLTPIVWLILDDLRLPMAWINRWTIIVAIFFIVHLVLLIVYKVRRRKRDEENYYQEDKVS